MKFIKPVLFVIINMIVFAAPLSAAGDIRIHERWAPVINQGAASEFDFITALDFDGDWTGNNNWRNAPLFPKPAVVYYDVKETASHWFIFYALFHPRDYTTDPECPSGCHENDLEGIQLTVRRDGSEFGDLEILETLAHGDIYLYTNKDYIKGGKLAVDGPVTMIKGRPAVFVEQYGHGIYGRPEKSIEANPMAVKMLRYVYTGTAETPDGIPDKKVGYSLVSIHDTIWARRSCTGDGNCFDAVFDYRGVPVPGSIDGDDYGRDAANTPWGYDQATGDGVVRGDWFFDPARAVLYHSGPIGDFETGYTLNPYPAELKKDSTAE